MYRGYKYFLFAFSNYYPKGGMNDCILKAADPKLVAQYAQHYLNKHPTDVDELQCYDGDTGKLYRAVLLKIEELHHYEAKILSWEEYDPNSPGSENKSSRKILYKDFRGTLYYKTANVIQLWSENGEELDDLPEDKYDDMKVVSYHLNSGCLHITLRR